MTLIERSLFFMLVVAVWSLPYATSTAALPLGRNGNNNVMEAVFTMTQISLKETLSSPQSNTKCILKTVNQMRIVSLNM